jgi:transposase
MVWQAICECGLKSTPYITTSTMNTDIYIKECLHKRILPMIRKHKKGTLFWPDLASCHYAKKTREWMAAKGVQFVQKDSNPPNCPEVRPIEQFWAIMKQKLRTKFIASDSIENFKKDWSKAAKMVSNEVVRNLMGSVRRRIRDIIRG